MADVKTTGAKKALAVLNAATKAPIEIPTKFNAPIMAPVIYLLDWVNRRKRTGGQVVGRTANMLPGGETRYPAFPKQAKTRDMNLVWDDTTGTYKDGIFGKPDANGMINGVPATFGQEIVYDSLYPVALCFLKHVFTKHDLAQNSLGNLVGMQLADFNAENYETELVKLKTKYVAAMGTVGKWATDKGFTPASSGVGKRLQEKDYSVDAAGGLEAIADIQAALEYREKIGRKDGVETDYPFARGLSPNSLLIEISSDINKAILSAVQDSKNGFIIGAGYNKETGLVNNIAYNGKIVSVEVITDMPQKSGKNFNWNIIEVGKYGSMAAPNAWDNKALVRPYTEGMALMHTVLEALGIYMDMKFLQPELMFSSFAAT